MNEQQSLLRLAEHLASESQVIKCELTDPDMMDRRCSGDAVAIRWEDGFADWVCNWHAARAKSRGRALIVRPRRHDGTGVSSPESSDS